MKILTFLLLFVAFGLSQQQIKYNGTRDLFPIVNDDTTKVQMVSANNTKLSGVYPYTYANRQFEYWVLTDSSKNVERTFYSIVQDTRNMFGGHFVTARADSIDSTMVTRLHIGLYRGYGYAGNDGMEWKYLGTLNGTNDSLKVTLSDSTWWLEELTTYYQYRFTEDSSGAQDLILHEFKYEEN